jgi:sulfate-transporting ATPase
MTDILTLQDVSKSFGALKVTDDVSFAVPKGQALGIIGPNGAGKSTLFRMILGKEKADKGKILIGKTVKIAHADQVRDELQSEKSVFEDILGGNDTIQVGKFQMPARSYFARFNFRGVDQ